MALVYASYSHADISTKAENESCIKPENPYDEDTGHYAGYNWAK